MTKTRRLVPSLYRALFDIARMRDEVKGFGGEEIDADARRLLSRLEQAERVALTLVERVEERSGTAAAH